MREVVLTNFVEQENQILILQQLILTVPKSQLYVDLELQLRGWAEDNEDNKNHTILATDSYIQFEAGTE
jgi:hypothetical protein